jgi:hypothetical protein
MNDDGIARFPDGGKIWPDGSGIYPDVAAQSSRTSPPAAWPDGDTRH